MPIITGTSASDNLTGTIDPDTIDGLAGSDVLSGGGGSDTIYGRDGDDIIDGGTGDDTMLGGTGNDVFTVNSASDGVVEFTNEGTDEIRTALADYTLLLASNVEKLTFTGLTGNFTGSGNALDNVVTGGTGQDTLQGFDGHDRLFGTAGVDILYGGAGDDHLDGGTGDDVMLGGAGNDVYIVDSRFDILSEEPGGGDDELRTSMTGFALGDGIEKLTFTGSADFLGHGNALDNIIVGGNGNDELHGAGGADRLEGGAGDDLYFVDDQDSVVESAGNGFDAIGTSLPSYSLATIANVEGLTYMGSGDFSGTGNALDNGIDGGGGNDTLLGLDGRDFLHGNGGNDVLDGGIGDDVMLGYAGNDTYIVDSQFDDISKSTGTDEIRTSLLTYNLATAEDVENLTFTGTGNFNGAGNALNNVIKGGAGSDTIDGAGGNDIFVLTGARDDYQVTGNPDGSFTLVDLRGGSPDGSDTIRSIEQVVFSNGVVATANLDHEAPFNALPATLSGVEDEPVFFSGGVFIDPTPTVVGDVDSATITSHLTVADGRFDAVTSTGAVITGNGTSDLIVSGSVADVNYVLYTLSYVPAADVSGTRTVTVETSDGELTDTDTINVSLIAVPDAPAGADRSFELAEDGTSPLQAADFGFTDADGDGMRGVHVVAAPTHGTIWNAGGYIVMIDVTGDGVPELITVQTPFAYAAGQTINRAHLDGGYVSYVPDPDFSGPDSFTFRVIDDSAAPGGLDTAPTPNILNFNMTEINDVPDLDLNGADAGTSNAIAFTENQVATLLAPLGTVTDPDALDYENGTLTVEFISGASFDDQLRIVDSGGISVDENSISWSGTVIGYCSGGTDSSQPLVITFNEFAVPAAVEALLRAVAFGNFSDVPVEGQRTLTFTLTDGDGGTSAPVTATVDVTAVDDVPIAFDDLANTGETMILDGNLLANDLDADGPPPVVTEVNGVAASVGSEITLASGAKLTVNADGTFSYDPNHVFDHLISFEKAVQNLIAWDGPGTDSFTYTINGGATATVSVIIEPVDGDGDVLRGNSGDNVLIGTDASEIFVLTDGGNDSVTGAGGDDLFVFGNTFTATDSIDGGDGYDTVFLDSNSFVVMGPTTLTNVENIVLTGSTTNLFTDEATIGAGAVLRIDGSAIGTADQFNFNGAAETDGRLILIGGAGQDSLAGGQGNDVLIGGGGFNTLVGANGSDTVDYSAAPTAVDANLQQQVAFDNGYADQDLLLGIENLTGSAHNDLLTGNAGSNRLDGGLGADQMIGNDGNDAYVVDNEGDSAFEDSVSGGIDIVRSSVSFALGQNVENLDLVGTGAIDGAGNDLANILTGNANDNILDGGLGADFMRGGLGNDTYVVRDAGDVVSELSGQGTDLVHSMVSHTLGAAVENLSLFGSDNIDGTGNLFANMLLGNSGANVLNGGGGADYMDGGEGNDTYIVDNVGDVVSEASTAFGTDEVRSSVTFTLIHTVENLVLTGVNAINGTGNNRANILTGNGAANVLDGGAGADTMQGGLGNDTYVIDDAGDVANENAGEGIDTIRTSVTHMLGAGFENLVLLGSGDIDAYGNSADNLLTGNSGRNTLYGGAGADTMAGGDGDDSYIVDNAGDKVIETAGGGTLDLVNSSITWTLGANVERLTLVGDQAINGTGNGLANALYGNDSNNRLDGGAGADVMRGGLGNDTYVIDDGGDVAIEAAGEGVDTIQTYFTSTLAAEFENLTLLGTDNVDGFGNAGNNILIGNSGANILNGGAGADVMNGGLGNDTYVVDETGDVVLETSAAGGEDRVLSTATFTLGSNVEHLTLKGTSAINGTGNALANVLAGNSAANILDGRGGADLMIGGLGNDIYVIDNARDDVVEQEGEGTDTALASLNYTLEANFENLTLTGTGNLNGTGNGANNVLTGNSGANTLDGLAGGDTMAGGGGNDTYVVESGLDKVIETAGGGIDTVRASLSHGLAAEVENLILTGVAANGYGNALANQLTGNDFANRLDGGAGADFMKGGWGDDVYVVDNVGDTVSELAFQGTDKVESAVDYTLGLAVENLTLTGGARYGTGNIFANVLIGNSAANVLNGGGGADTMNAGLGDDLYIVDNVGDSVFETSTTGGYDEVESSVTFALSTNIENLTLTGTAAINGTGNALNNILTGNDGANILDGGAGFDRLYGGLGDDTYLVEGTDQVTETDAAGGVDHVISSVNFTLGANLENLTITGTIAQFATGNALANTVTGNALGNWLSGRDGNDTIVGGGGGDQLYGEAGDDQLDGGLGDDVLRPGEGNDTMTGGEGEDAFILDTVPHALSNVDVIMDFEVGTDRLLLLNDAFSGIPDLLFNSAFRLGDTALDADDRLLYDSTTGHLFYDADGVGGVDAIHFASFTPGTALTMNDIIVF